MNVGQVEPTGGEAGFELERHIGAVQLDGDVVYAGADQGRVDEGRELQVLLVVPFVRGSEERPNVTLFRLDEAA